MKPLSELVTELRVRQTECGKDLEEPLAALAHYCWKEAADELQAWLREAEKWVASNEYQAVKLLGETGNPQVNSEDVLRELLGTTQKATPTPAGKPLEEE